MKTIVTASYAKSTIYPMTVDGRLFTVRDLGTDWTIKNKNFEIEELDPVTGRLISSTSVEAEWFTVLGDRLYFQSGIDDFWPGQPRGGHLKVKQLGDGTRQTERQLSVKGYRFHAVDGQLVSLTDAQINVHNPETGEVMYSRQIDPGLIGGIWPSQRSVFFGDEAIYWAALFDDPSEAHIIRATTDSEPTSVVRLEMEGYETGVVIDEVPGMLMIGVTSSSPRNGIGITEMFLIDLENETGEEMTVDRHIPLGEMSIGGGLQMLRLSPD